MNKRFYFLTWKVSTFLFCTLGVLWSFYLEFFQKQNPCPLCIAQRIILIFITFCILLQSLFYFIKCGKFIKLFYFLEQLFLVLGLYFSGRQIYLQHLPVDQIPSCMPSLKILFDILPFQEIIKVLFWGSGDCAQVTLRYMGLSLSEIAFLSFLFLLLGNLRLYYKR